MSISLILPKRKYLRILRSSSKSASASLMFSFWVCLFESVAWFWLYLDVDFNFEWIKIFQTAPFRSFHVTLYYSIGSPSLSWIQFALGKHWNRTMDFSAGMWCVIIFFTLHSSSCTQSRFRGEVQLSCLDQMGHILDGRIAALQDFLPTLVSVALLGFWTLSLF